jgi:hypothetical protein
MEDTPPQASISPPPLPVSALEYYQGNDPFTARVVRVLSLLTLVVASVALATSALMLATNLGLVSTSMRIGMTGGVDIITMGAGMVLQSVLLAFAILCLGGREAGRSGLLISSVVAIGYYALAQGFYTLRYAFMSQSGADLLLHLAYSISWFISPLILPVLVVIFFRTPEVKGLFQRR